ncbi:type III PLP-dependent enzyme [Sphingomonas sp.]|uniref:type III PLP-dependent enzyme n=1 Tax=Sphingomonas sp. TaxID=28214 RepID=UPI003B3BC2F3
MHKHPRALGLAIAPVKAGSVLDIALGQPVQPVTIVRPHAARRAARFFVEKFKGRSLYAVKANPSPELIAVLWESGITHFDVASIAEVRLVSRAAPGATLCFMHPVKAEEAIREAYFVHGVRTFSLDTIEELEKIMRATDDATDLTLCVRLRVSSEHSKLSLASKFGAAPDETKALLFAARQAADALGICFHVGSQAMSPQAYVQALARVRAAIVEAAVTVDVIDVGGGFPSVYPGMEPIGLENYFRAIEDAFEALPISYSAELWAEPGRALCAEYASLLVRVERRRGDQLYINDGAYGALFDAAHVGWRFPVALVREQGSDAKDMEFSFYGPTCDDIDHMAGPFLLPADIGPGDYIEIGMLGAYGCAMRTAFNGFTAGETVVLEDEPMTSLYVDSATEPAFPANVVKL